jgi:hypothetical protein
MRTLDPRLVHAPTGSAIDHRTDTKHFARHVFEMTAAMLLGMAVLGALFREVHVIAFGTGFDDLWHRHTELAVFGMTFNMTIPMVAWMRHRGHSWRPCAEMAAAMFVLALALLVLFWVGAISAHGVLPLEMALMLPAMLLVMLHRFHEYTGHRNGGAHPSRTARHRGEPSRG